MNGQDETALISYWTRETSNLNHNIDSTFKEAQDHAYDLGWQRGIQQADAELVESFKLAEIYFEDGAPNTAFDVIRAAIANATAKGK